MSPRAAGRLPAGTWPSPPRSGSARPSRAGGCAARRSAARGPRPGRAGLRVLAFWSGPSPAAASSRIRLAVLACLQAADGSQPAEPVIRDLVTFAAQLLGQRDLAQARAGVPGTGDDAPGGCDELAVTAGGVRVVLALARFRFGPGSRDGTGGCA